MTDLFKAAAATQRTCDAEETSCVQQQGNAPATVTASAIKEWVDRRLHAGLPDTDAIQAVSPAAVLPAGQRCANSTDCGFSLQCSEGVCSCPPQKSVQPNSPCDSNCTSPCADGQGFGKCPAPGEGFSNPNTCGECSLHSYPASESIAMSMLHEPRSHTRDSSDVLRSRGYTQKCDWRLSAALHANCSAGPSLASRCCQRAKQPIEGVQRLCGGRAARHMVLGMPLLTVHFAACSFDMLPCGQPADSAESRHWAAGSPQDCRRHARGRDPGRSLQHTCQRAVMSVSDLFNTSLCLDVPERQLQVHHCNWSSVLCHSQRQ